MVGAASLAHSSGRFPAGPQATRSVDGVSVRQLTVAVYAPMLFSCGDEGTAVVVDGGAGECFRPSRNTPATATASSVKACRQKNARTGTPHDGNSSAGVSYPVPVTLVGDADRDRALALLKRHYAEGRFDHDELTRRIGVAVGARSTADVFLALRGLPERRVRSRGAAPPGPTPPPRLRTVRRVALAVIVSAVWMFATMMVVVRFAISLLVAGPSTPVAVVLAAAWGLMTWGSWRTWCRRSRRA